MLFLKYLDDLETEREEEAELDGKEYDSSTCGYWREQASCAQTHGDPKNLRQNLVTLGIISYLCTVISNL